MLENISVILVEPSGSMNIGMTARAMKNCGITDLRLVAPVKFKPLDAYMMACSAKDVVDNARVFKTLPEALADTSASAAFSRRMAKTRAPFYALKDISETLAKRAAAGKLALVFGREADGLTKEELYACDFRVFIPTSPIFGSMNLAQAVLLACYEMFCLHACHCEGESPKQSPESTRGIATPTSLARNDTTFATREEAEPMFRDFAQLLKDIGYTGRLDDKLRKKISQAFGEICGRAGLRRKDVNMFIGIWAQVRKAIKSSLPLGGS